MKKLNIVTMQAMLQEISQEALKPITVETLENTAVKICLKFNPKADIVFLNSIRAFASTLRSFYSELEFLSEGSKISIPIDFLADKITGANIA